MLPIESKISNFEGVVFKKVFTNEPKTPSTHFFEVCGKWGKGKKRLGDYMGILGKGRTLRKNTKPYIFKIPVFIKQELDNLETQPTALKSTTMKTKNHQQNYLIKHNKN